MFILIQGFFRLLFWIQKIYLCLQSNSFNLIMHRIDITLCFLLVILPFTLGLFPKPRAIKLSQQQFLKIDNVCNIRQISHPQIEEQQKVLKMFKPVQSDSMYYLNKILKRKNNNLHCTKDVILIKDINQDSMIDLKIYVDQSKVQNKQGYIIQIQKQSPHFKIIVNQYSGYVYALQTLSQLLEDKNVPIGSIQDSPLVSHRGVMIDSARHFTQITTLQRLIQSLPMSKLNILHWHLSDDESFQIKLNSHPELAQESAFKPGQYYNVDQVKNLIALAKKNAVSIIPEIDSPAHVRSWGIAPKWKQLNLTVLCPRGQFYNHQLDVSKQIAYDIGQDIYQQINNLFIDSPYIHMGGDQVFAACWDLRPDIKTFMAKKNISDYGELQMYWRRQMKSVLPSNRSVVFWRNDNSKISFDKNDIIHYWGAAADIPKILGDTTSKIILSPAQYCYFNHGIGNIWSNASAGSYIVWKQIYKSFEIFPAGVNKTNILGAEVALWGEQTNDDLIQNMIWMRGSAFAAKVWTDQVLSIKELVKDIVILQNQLIKIGVSPSPIVSQFCQKFTDKCLLS